jgi:hypothetical protein
MLGALYINKVHAEEAEEEEENEQSLEVNRGVSVQDLEHLFEVSLERMKTWLICVICLSTQASAGSFSLTTKSRQFGTVS